MQVEQENMILCSLILESDYRDLLIEHFTRRSERGKLSKKDKKYIDDRLSSARFLVAQRPPQMGMMTSPPQAEEEKK